MYFGGMLALAAMLLTFQALPAPSPTPSPGTIAAGDAAFAAGEFRIAFSDYQLALRDDPHDTRALTGAGTIELYGNDLPDAKRDLTDAANAGNPRAAHELAILKVRTQSWDIRQGSGDETIALVAVDPLPIVEVTVNGRKTRFFIDTGAGNTVLDAGFAKSLHLRTHAAQMGTFAGGSHAQVSTAQIGTLSVGPFTVRNVAVDVLPLPSLPSPYKIEGLLGTGFLYHFLSTIDFRHGTLRLLPRAQSIQYSRQFGQADSVPMWLVGDHFIFTHAHVNVAPEALFNIDTGGAGFGVQLAANSLGAARIPVNPQARQTGVGGAGAVTYIPFVADATIGKTTVKNLPGFYTPQCDQYGLFPFSVAGSITHLYFRHLRVTFDFDAMRLYLEQ
jgi:Aspartyl protease